MAKTISITVSGRMHAALGNEARQYEKTEAEFLKSFLDAAAMSKDGLALKLTLPPLGPDPRQTMLPLDVAQDSPEGAAT